MDLLAEKQKLVGRTFRHFKGNLYRLEGFAKDSETLEEMVVYRALYGECGLWVRPAKMFFETVERDGKKMNRFELKDDNTIAAAGNLV
jgi:hypothetical protein